MTNGISFQPGGKGTLAAMFAQMDMDRNGQLNRAREHARLTIPALLPPEGRSQDQELEIPYSSTPADAINSLVSKITSVILPVDQRSMFEFVPDSAVERSEDPEERNAQLQAEQAVFRAFEHLIGQELAPTNVRSATTTALKHLVVVGDALMFQTDDNLFQVFRTDQYVVRRRSEGEWATIILKEMIDPMIQLDRLPDDPMDELTSDTSERTFDGREPVYTKIDADGKGGCRMVREWRGQQFDEGSFKTCPYYPLRWSHVAGEDYGISLIEEVFGDVRAMDSLTKSLIEGSSLNAEYRWLLNAAGILELDDFVQSANGETVVGSPGDLTPLTFQNAAQVQTTAAALSDREVRFGRRFLMNTVTQPTGERVTAFQSNIFAQELEQGLGGILSLLTRELQLPMIRRTIDIVTRKRQVPSDVRNALQDQDLLKIRIRAGLEILARESEAARVNAIAANFRNLPEPILEAIDGVSFAQVYFRANGLDQLGIVRSREQVEARRQAAIQQQQAEQAQQVAGQAALATIQNQQSEETA